MGIRLSLLSGMMKKKPKKSLPSCEEQSESLSSMCVPTNSRTEREESGYVFRKFDINGDGKISCSELGSIMKKLGHSATEDELQRLMKDADIDEDGFIDLNEFIELNTRNVDSGKVLDDLRNAFLIFDTDGNGSISSEELQSVFMSLGEEISIPECQKMIKGVDSDGDGSICFQEFLTMMMGSGFKR